MIGSVQFGFDLKILEQSQLYIQNINENRNTELNYWALSKLYSGTCLQNNVVMRSVADSRNPELIQIFSTYRCGKTNEENAIIDVDRIRYISLDKGFENVAIYYLFNTDQDDDRTRFVNEFTERWSADRSKNLKIVHQHLNEGLPLIAGSISGGLHPLFLYSILYDGNIYSVEFDQQLEVVLQKWIDEYVSNELPSLTTRSVQFANLVRLAFEINALPTVQQLLERKPDGNYFPLSGEKTRYLSAVTYSLLIVGRYDQALNLLRNQLIPIAEYLGLQNILEEATFRKGISLYSLGKFQEAREIFEEIYYNDSSVIDKTELFNNLSICYLKLGEKNQYIEYQLTALNEAKDNNNYSNQLIILRNLFVFYTSLRDQKTAQYYLDIAEQIATEQNDAYELAAIHSFSGTFHWEFNRNAEKALEELHLAQVQYDVNKNYFDFINSKKEEARIHLTIDSLDQAAIVYSEIADIATQLSNSNDYLEARIGLADVYIRQNRLKEAFMILEEIRSYTVSGLDFEASVNYKTVIASLLQKSGKIQEAHNELSPVIEQISDRARSSIDSQSGLWTLRAEYIDAFNLYIDILMDQGSNARTLQVLDNLKTINDAALYNSPLLRSQQLTEEELARDQILSEQIQKLRNEFLNASSVTQGFEIKRQIDRLSARREEILSRVRSKIKIQDVDIWTVQRILNKNELVLHFTEVGDRLYVSQISSDHVDVKSVSFDKRVQSMFQEAADKLASSETDLLLLRSVFKHLELDITHLTEGSTLIVIPDNSLYRIPMGVFPVNPPRSATSYGNTTYLLEKVDIEYFTSLNAFSENHRLNRAEKAGFSAYAISDFSSFESDRLITLPYTIQEVNAINKTLEQLPDRSLYLGSEATKDSFLRGIQTSSIVHVATHSEVSEQDPLFSTVYLNSDEKPAKALHAYELFDVAINSDLIMMNSCSSGSGGYLQGSGILGLTRVLRYAGAKSLGLNIWSVNDKSASDFATRFYEYIDSGESKSVAMREAKLSLLYSGNANPYYWGGFMLIGNQEPLTKKPERTGLSYLLLMAVIIGGSYFAHRSI